MGWFGGKSKGFIQAENENNIVKVEADSQSISRDTSDRSPQNNGSSQTSVHDSGNGNTINISYHLHVHVHADNGDDNS